MQIFSPPTRVLLNAALKGANEVTFSKGQDRPGTSIAFASLFKNHPDMAATVADILLGEEWECAHVRWFENPSGTRAFVFAERGRRSELVYPAKLDVSTDKEILERARARYGLWSWLSIARESWWIFPFGALAFFGLAWLTGWLIPPIVPVLPEAEPLARNLNNFLILLQVVTTVIGIAYLLWFPHKRAYERRNIRNAFRELWLEPPEGRRPALAKASS